MSIASWQVAIMEEIPKILKEEPTENRAVFLAALYAIKSELSNNDNKEHHIAIEKAESEKPVDDIMINAQIAYDKYFENKAHYQNTPSDTAKMEMLSNLNELLEALRQIIVFIWRSADTNDERDDMKEFFKHTHESHR